MRRWVDSAPIRQWKAVEAAQPAQAAGQETAGGGDGAPKKDKPKGKGAGKQYKKNHGRGKGA